jgi:glycosyltransferase involved in cell wall biosynthesis
MADAPVISVIVPAHNASEFLPRSISALLKSDLPRSRWELILVDDASSDTGIAAASESADTVVTLPAPPRGPASARNSGAEAAHAPIVAFVDADVCVHPDALSRMVEHFRSDPELGAVFGSYDALPSHPGFVSQYRNLLHHYVHQCNGGEAGSFWAGCGAVRVAAFLEAGRFDELRYPRPQIEDIELGYRLRDAGYHLILDPAIQGTHLKRWTLPAMLNANFHHRGLPYTQLLLERGQLLNSQGLSVGSADKAGAVLAALAVLTIAAAAVLRDWRWLAVLILCFVAFGFVNRSLLGWYAKERGVWFATRAAAMHLVYHVTNVVAVIYASIAHAVRRRS